MKSKILIWLSKNWKKNRGKDYPQTWYYMPPRWSRHSTKTKHHMIGYPFRLFIEWLCGICGGHELSKTEWGYGGGDYADRHCRWCDKVIRVPKESVWFAFRESDAKDWMSNISNKAN